MSHFTARTLMQHLESLRVSPLGLAVALLLWSGEVTASTRDLAIAFPSRNEGSLRRILSQLAELVPDFINSPDRAEQRGGYITTTHTTINPDFELNHRKQGATELNQGKTQKTTDQDSERKPTEGRVSHNGGATRGAVKSAASTERARWGTRSAAETDAPPDEVLALANRFSGYLETVSDTDLVASIWQVWIKYPHRREFLHEIVDSAMGQTANKERAGEIRIGTLKYLCGTMRDMARLGTWRKPSGRRIRADGTGPAEKEGAPARRPDHRSPRASTPTPPNQTASSTDPAAVSWMIGDPYGEAVADIWLFAHHEWRMVLTRHWEGRVYLAIKALCEVGGVQPGRFRQALAVKAAQAESSACYWARRIATATDMEKALTDLLNEVDVRDEQRPAATHAKVAQRPLITPADSGTSWGKGSVRLGPGWTTGRKSEDFYAYAEVAFADAQPAPELPAEPLSHEAVFGGNQLQESCGEAFAGDDWAEQSQAQVTEAAALPVDEPTAQPLQLEVVQLDAADQELAAKQQSMTACTVARIDAECTAERLAQVEAERAAEQARVEAERVRQAQADAKTVEHRLRWQELFYSYLAQGNTVHEIGRMRWFAPYVSDLEDWYREYQASCARTNDSAAA